VYDVPGFRFTETTHGGGIRLTRHSHPHPAMTLVLAGGFIEELSGYEHVCRPMSVIAKPAGAVHANRYSSLGSWSFILECVGAGEIFAGFDRCGPQIGFVSLVPILLELHRACREQAPERAVLVEELSLEVIHQSANLPRRGDSQPPRWLRRIEAMVREGSNRPLRLSQLGEEAGVHPVYLARVFRRCLGRSVGSYMLHCRLEQSMTRLAASSDSLSRIALEAGFSDQPCFTRLFKREVGKTPARFRKLSRDRFRSFKT
jgi:AraC family transcriptional regulator